MDSRNSTMLKVISPIEGKNGKTYWIRIGNAFPNRDGSTNVYLNAYPMTGKLQIRPLDERDYASSGASNAPAEPPPSFAGAAEDLPF